MTSSKCFRRKVTESAIMARFSSSVVPIADVTWKSQDFPKMVTAGGPDSGPPGRPEGGDLRNLEHGVLDAAEEAQVLRIGAGPPALDVVHAERVQALGDANLVFHGEGDALALGAVAEGRVVHLDQPGHRGILQPSHEGNANDEARAHDLSRIPSELRHRGKAHAG